MNLKFHSRNIYQVIGPKGASGTKSDILIYCADDDLEGLAVGGTRTAVVFAKQLGIPVYNIRGKVDSSTINFKLILDLIKSNPNEETVNFILSTDWLVIILLSGISVKLIL